jgi:hypothetical protein
MNTYCPEIGVWRAWLDHESDSTDLESHLASCPACKRLVAELREDASDVHDALSVLAPTHLPTSAEVAVARQRLEWRRAASSSRPSAARTSSLESVPMILNHISTPWRIAASGLAAAVALALIVAFTPEGGSVAEAFLASFRPQQVAAIGVTPQSQAEIFKALNALGNLGTINVPGGPNAVNPARPQSVVRAAESQPKAATLAEAADTVGAANFLLPDPARLPAGVSRTPQVRIVPGSQIHFTFEKKKAQAYYQSSGHPEVSLPDKFDGATIVVTIPSAAVLEYTGSGSNKDTLVVGEAGQLEIDVQGNVSLSELRDFLLGLPGLPADVVSQLKHMDNWTDTLPIPLPIDQVQWQSDTIHGAPGLILKDNSGVGSAAIWHANNHMYGVAGTLKATDLKPIADTLAVR